MAADKLQLKVILSALDKVTAPLKRIQGGSIGAGKALKDTRDKIKQLNDTQRDITGFKEYQAQLQGTGNSLQETRDKLGALQRAVESHRTAQQALAGETKVHRTAVSNLQRELLRSKEPNAELSKQYMIAKDNLAKLETKYNASQNRMRRYKQELGDTTTAARNLNSKHQALSQKLADARTKLDAAGVSTDKLAQHEKDLAGGLDKANAALKVQKDRLAAITRQQERLARAKSQYQKTQALAGNMAGSGAAGLATGSGMLYAGARMIAPGIEYGAQMSELQAVTRLDKGDERFAMLKQQARDLGASTAFSATDVGAGQTFLARAGFTPEAINASMQDVLNLALANGVDLARTADIASNISSAFKIDPEVGGNITRVTDVLSGAAARANVDLEMLGDTMKYMGSAEGLGLSLEQAATMAGLLGNIGVQGSQAGTTMRAMLNRLTAPAKAAQDSIETLGLKVGDSAGNMRALPDILQDVATATAKMGNIERAAHMKNIFGEEAGSGMAELIAKQGTGALTKLLGELQNVAGENAKMAATRADNIDGDLKGLRSAWEEVGIGITDVNEGPLREFIQSTTEVIRGVGLWIKANPELVAQIVKTAAGLGILIAAGGGLALTLASILGPIAMVRYGMALFSIKGGGLLSMLWSLGKTALPLVAKGIMLIGRALLMNPIGLAITAIGLAAYAIYENWEPIKAFFSQTWGEIVMDSLNFLGRMTKAFLDWNPLGLFYTVFADVLSWFGIDIPRKFTDAGVAIVQGLITGFTSMFPNLTKAIGSIADSTIGFFKEKLGIHSPSRVFAELGGFTMAGLGKGLANGEGGVLKQIAGTAKRVASAGADMLGRGAGISFDSRPPISTGRTGTAAAAAAPITINIYPAAGMDSAAIGREVQRQLAAAQQQQQARQRGRLSDQE